MQSHVKKETLETIADGGQLLAVGLLLDLLLFEGTQVIGLVRLSAMAALLFGVLKSQGWLVLLALQASLFLRAPHRPEMMFGFVPGLYSLTSIGIVAYTYLGQPFRNRVSKWLVLQILIATGGAEPIAVQSIQPQNLRLDGLRLAAIQFGVWMAIIVVAMLALMRLPISAGARSEWLRSAIENDFTIWPGATLLVLSLLLVIVFAEAGWRQMTVAQASLYMRSAFALDHYWDLRMIVLRRLKKKRVLVDASTPKKQLVERVAEVPPKL